MYVVGAVSVTLSFALPFEFVVAWPAGAAPARKAIPLPVSGLPAAVRVAVSVALPPGGTAPLGPVSFRVVGAGAALAGAASSATELATAVQSSPARPQRSHPTSLICIYFRPRRPGPLPNKRPVTIRAATLKVAGARFDRCRMHALTRLRSRLTYANAMSTIAVFVALGGGAYAVSVPRNSVGTTQLKANAVTAAKVKNRSLLASDFKRGQLILGTAARADDQDPPAAPSGTDVAKMTLTTRSPGKVFVIGSLRDPFLTCARRRVLGPVGRLRGRQARAEHRRDADRPPRRERRLLLLHALRRHDRERSPPGTT